MYSNPPACTTTLAAGDCICVGFAGVNCTQPCPLGRWGVQCEGRCSCANGGQCEKASAKCVCPAGYSGEHCEDRSGFDQADIIFPVCPANRYGIDCDQSCTCDMEHTETCDTITGEYNSPLALP